MAELRAGAGLGAHCVAPGVLPHVLCVGLLLGGKPALCSCICNFSVSGLFCATLLWAHTCYYLFDFSCSSH